MRIAVVHPYPVHPAAVGGVTRVYELVRYLAARRHEVTVLTHAPTGADVHVDRGLSDLGVAQHAFPLPAATRARKLAWWFDADPYFVNRNVNPALASTLAAMDRAAAFDVVHLELAYMAPCLGGVGPRAVRVLAEQEVMSQVVARLGRLPWRDRTAYERLAPLMADKVRRFEHHALRAFDLLYGITPGDRSLLQSITGRPAAVHPHVVVADRFQPPVKHDGETDRILFVGNFGHRPNLHAAIWFVEQVWPSIRAHRPSARFTIAGPGMPDAARIRLAAPGVEIGGYAPDLPALYHSAPIVVTPVQSGGGMRGKVLEAFASGCAVVGSAMSFEGIDCTSGVDCTAADTPAAFAAAVVRYAKTPALRAAHGAAARALVRRHYDAPAVFARLEQDLERAVLERQLAMARRTTA